MLKRLFRFSFIVLAACAVTLSSAVSSCSSSDPTGPLCPSITGDSNGLQITGCTGGTVSQTGVTHDATGAKSSYAFVVNCKNNRSAHGIWTRANGIECVEGPYPCDGGDCMPESNVDCRVLTNCIELGECGFADGGCVLTDEGCSSSEIPCGLSGACHLVGGACVATSDTDCQTPFGSCPDCDFKGPCVTSGNCYEKDGGCIAKQDGDCKKSEQCAFAGRCSLDGESCVAASNSDCAGSEVCRTAGQCMAVAGVCAVE